jgi:hypothetical protein
MPCGIDEVIAEYRHAKPSSSSVIANVMAKVRNVIGRVVAGHKLQTALEAAGATVSGAKRV